MSEISELRAMVMAQAESLTILAETVAMLASTVARLTPIDPKMAEGLDARSESLRRLAKRAPP